MKNLIFITILCAFCIAKTFAQVTYNYIGSSSGNSFGGYMATKHTFAYNADLNLMVFGHRGGGAAGGSANEMYYDYSTDGGVTWTPHVQMPNPVPGNFPRFPQMCIWNPSGNTDIADAKVVTTGPFIYTPNLVWGGSYLASANVIGAANTTYGFQTTPNRTPTEIDHNSLSLCNINGGMAYVSGRMDSASRTTRDRTIDFWKITPNSNGGFSRNIKFSITPNLCSATDSVNFGYDMAFGRFGYQGYISYTTGDMSGQRAENYNRTPILYHTIDAGETWTKLKTIDLQSIPLIMDSTSVANDGQKHPTMIDSRMTVDNTGRCHLFAEIASASTPCTDSIQSAAWEPNSSFVVHFVISGNSVQTYFVGRNKNTKASFGQITDAFDEQYQVARSEDGQHIFFTMLETSSAATGGHSAENIAPNLWVYAFDANNQMYMPLRNMTAGTDAENAVFFARLPPIVPNIPNGNALPVMVMTGGESNMDASVPVEFAFIKGIKVLTSDYSVISAAAYIPMYSLNSNLQCSNTACSAFSNTSCGMATSIQVIRNIVCNNDTTGNIQVAVSGGNAPYTYAWSNGATSRNITSLTAGVYTVTITNATGCSATESITLTNPAPMTVGATTQPETCSDLNGRLELNVMGGVAPYGSTIFNWFGVYPNLVYDYLQTGNYVAYIRDANGCGIVSEVFTVGQNISNCVYPGDANNDGIANNYDLLPVALGSGITGGTRPRYAYETTWRPCTSPDFANNTPNTIVNQKYADCNGDGIINQSDLNAININYGSTHQRNAQAEVWTNNAPTITCMFPTTTTGYGGDAHVLHSGIMVGDATNPATDITGLAFSIDYDTVIAESAFMELDSLSWLGAPSELYSIQRITAPGHIELAISRFDGTTRNGMGQIASCNFVITDNVIGRDPNNPNRLLNVSVTGIRAINNQNVPKAINGVATQVIVENMVVATSNSQLAQNIRILPNPTNGVLNIQANSITIENLTLTDMVGQVLISQKAFDKNKNNTISLENLPQGSYFLIIDTPEGKLTQKIVKM